MPPRGAYPSDYAPPQKADFGPISPPPGHLGIPTAPPAAGLPSFYLGANIRPATESSAEEEKAKFGMKKFVDSQKTNKHESVRAVEQGIDPLSTGLPLNSAEYASFSQYIYPK